ncbi:MAG: hypothetical protein EBW87_04520 [Burkholderiaceae bacterium]|jgi:co-chaperonin GroES (HSP10)|nr:hypothetical protein [Burkholderiaceae bacterium]
MPKTPDKLARENNGLPSLDPYTDCPLPEDYEITELLGSVVMAEYADVAADGKSLVRNGIILPHAVVENKSWRVGKVLLSGPDCTQVKTGQHIIFPGDKGIVGIQRGGKTVIFLDETRIFGICELKKR